MSRLVIVFNHSKTYHITKRIKYNKNGMIEYKTDNKNKYIVPLNSILYIKEKDEHE